MADTINNVKNTFSSWNSCMSKTYCKWPVIAGIIVGSLILFSVLFCIARCICCGAECVCCCFKCCSGCCGSGRGHGHSSRDESHQPLHSVPSTPYGGPPGGGGLPMYNQQYRSAPAPVYQQNAFAQTATFEGKVHEDSLPAMPSWDTAQERRVEVIEEVKPATKPGEGEEHEMEKLSPTGQGQRTPSPLAGFAAPAPVHANARAHPALGVGSAPHSPYGNETDPFLQGGQHNGVLHGDGYRSPPLQQGGSGGAAAVGYGFANHRPGGLQNQQPSYNSYQDSQSDHYGQQTGYVGQQSRAQDQSYGGQGRPQHDNRQYGNVRPSYEDDHHQMPSQQMPNHQDYRQDNRSPQYGQQYQQDHYDQHQHQQGYGQANAPFRAFSPAYGQQQPAQGSWKDI